jgi:hypothetical protein
VVVIAIDLGFVEIAADAQMSRHHLFPIRVYLTGGSDTVISRGIVIRRNIPEYEAYDAFGRIQCYCVHCGSVVADLLHCRRCHSNDCVVGHCPNCELDEPIRLALEAAMRRRLGNTRVNRTRFQQITADLLAGLNQLNVNSISEDDTNLPVPPPRYSTPEGPPPSEGVQITRQVTISDEEVF